MSGWVFSELHQNDCLNDNQTTITRLYMFLPVDWTSKPVAKCCMWTADEVLQGLSSEFDGCETSISSSLINRSGNDSMNRGITSTEAKLTWRVERWKEDNEFNKA